MPGSRRLRVSVTGFPVLAGCRALLLSVLWAVCSETAINASYLKVFPNLRFSFSYPVSKLSVKLPPFKIFLISVLKSTGSQAQAFKVPQLCVAYGNIFLNVHSTFAQK
jgi:hypothetical protein